LSYKSDGVRVWKTTTWKTIKNERPTKKIRRNIQILRGASSAERAKKKAGIGKWIQRYNIWRPHQALGNKTPALVYGTNRKPSTPGNRNGKSRMNTTTRKHPLPPTDFFAHPLQASALRSTTNIVGEHRN
jgi:hypothetical protein